MIALLTGAVMFALGLFFGWLLHRERVERALYEDAVRARDRANTTLAETSARLELANRDLVRLREQLTDAQHRLEHLDDASAQRERDDADAGAGSDDPSPADDDDAADRVDMAVTASGRRRGSATRPGPVDAQLFDLDGEVDITEEVPLPSADAVGTPPVDEDEGAVDPGVSPAPSVEDVVEAENVDGDERDAAEADQDAPSASIAEGVEDDREAREPSASIVEDAGGDADVREPSTWTDEGVDETAPSVSSAGIADDAAEHAAPTAPTPTEPDDLRLISGVGPALERLLHEHGITTFRDLALLDDAAIGDLRSRSPRLVTRLRRDAWVSQARRLHIEAHGDEP